MYLKQIHITIRYKVHYTMFITGTRNDSRIEYAKLPGRQLEGFDLTINFRTFDENGGLIFYAAAERNPSQFLALYMKDAQVCLHKTNKTI